MIFTTSFVAGLLVISFACAWGIAAWLVSPEVNKRKPAPLQSNKPKKIEQHRIARRNYLFWKWSIPALISLIPISFLVGHLSNGTGRPAVNGGMDLLLLFLPFCIKHHQPFLWMVGFTLFIVVVVVGIILVVTELFGVEL